MAYTIKEANLLLGFLSRATLQGAEVDAFKQAVDLIRRETEIPEEEKQKK